MLANFTVRNIGAFAHQQQVVEVAMLNFFFSIDL